MRPERTDSINKDRDGTTEDGILITGSPLKELLSPSLFRAYETLGPRTLNLFAFRAH